MLCLLICFVVFLGYSKNVVSVDLFCCISIAVKLCQPTPFSLLSRAFIPPCLCIY